MPEEQGRGPDEILVEPFPLWILPQQLQELVADGACSIGCPPDYIVVPMLGVLGTAIGTRRQIKIKEGWRESAVTWTAIVGDTGSAKSPGLQLAVEPLYRLQSEFLAEHLADQKSSPTAREAGPDETTKASSESDTEDRVLQPVPKRIVNPRQAFTTDATMEALNVSLARTPHGIALVRDELTAWVLAMNEYKQGSGADRPHWQSMWNSSPVIVNRKNRRAPLIIPKPFVSVIGGLPPAMLRELCDERGREDGFIHRILFTFPDPVPRVLSTEGVAAGTIGHYCRFFDRLRSRRMIMCSEESETVVLDMAPDAFVEFQHWVNGHFTEMENGPVNLRGPWAKLVTYCARFALIIYLARTVTERTVASTVDVNSVRCAIALANYFKSHTRKVYRHLFATAAERQIMAAIEWLRKRPGLCSTKRDFQTFKVGGVRTAEDASALFVLLERNGWGRIDYATPKRGGQVSVRFTLDCRSSAAQLQT